MLGAGSVPSNLPRPAAHDWGFYFKLQVGWSAKIVAHANVDRVLLVHIRGLWLMRISNYKLCKKPKRVLLVVSILWKQYLQDDGLDYPSVLSINQSWQHMKRPRINPRDQP